MLSKSSSKPIGRARLEAIDEVFRALAHPTRRHILLVLHHRGGSMTAGEIADRFSCKWPTVSRHLRRLEQAGLVSTEKHGREWIYSLQQHRLMSVAGGWLEAFGDE